MDAPETGPRLGLSSAVALVVANMIGVGVFTTSGFALGDLGSREWVLLAWAVGGVLALLGAVSYGALARRMPESGGEYLFLSRAVHPLVGFLAGWVSLLAGFTAPIAASAAGLGAYLSPWIGAGRGAWVGATAIVAAGLMHGIKIGGGAALQTLVVALKLLLIAGFLAVGLWGLPGAVVGASDSVPFDTGAFAVTLVWISFSYSGWNAAVYIASEIRDPERNVGRALWIGTGIVVVAYLGLNAVFVYSGPIEKLSDVAEIGAVAAHELGGEPLRNAVSAIVAVALFTSISAMVMAGPRVYAAMAEDGLFPRVFDAGAKVPTAAIALQVGLAVVVLWASELRDLLTYIGFTLSLSTAATVTVLMWLRYREGRERVPVPGYPVVQIVFIAATLAIGGYLALRQPDMFFAGVGTVGAGIPMYFLMRRLARRAGP